MRSLSQQGFALLAALPILSLLAVFGALIALHTIASRRLDASRFHHAKSHHILSSILIDRLANAPLVPGLNILRESDPRTSTIHRDLIFTVSQPETPPAIDFFRLLQGATNCEESTLSRDLSRSGFPLTPSSVVADKTCPLPMPGHRYRGNFDTPLIASTEPLLVAFGYTDIQRLNVTQDLTILSAGDIHLGMIEVSGGNPELTLISTTGVIVVDNSPASVTFRVTAHGGIYLPLGAVIQPIDTSPIPVFPKLTLGIFRGETP